MRLDRWWRFSKTQPLRNHESRIRIMNHVYLVHKWTNFSRATRSARNRSKCADLDTEIHSRLIRDWDSLRKIFLSRRVRASHCTTWSLCVASASVSRNCPHSTRTMIVSSLDARTRVRAAQPATGTRQTLAELNVTNPTECDVDFILHAFDSALAYLASIGSEAQWGTIPFSAKPDQVSHFTNYVEECYLQASANSGSGSIWQSMLLYEVKQDTSWTRVAALGISTAFPSYVPDSLADNSMRQAADYVYLKYLVTDRRCATLSKRSAAHLMAFAEQTAREMHMHICYGDCWRGNGDGLLKYYQHLGYTPLGAFDVKDKHGPGLPWSGYLFSKSLSH